ncbi:MAG: hypothetical protein IPM12_07975 [Flavobacteriales bacterium]|nr:hypothetical protein [Flavobacteriales bacterium]
MKHACISLLTLVALASSVTRSPAQNLVPNGSFEEYITCPWALAQVDSCVGWKTWYYTPDYFHSCSKSNLNGVPQNIVVNQLPSHGDAYCGFNAALPFQDAVEILGAELTQELDIGVPIHVSLKLAAGIGGTQINYRHTCDKVGVRFTTTEQQWVLTTPLPDYAHLVLSDPIETIGEWTTLSGTFVPDSAYRYISIGRFHTWDSLQFVEVNPDGTNPGAYFLVDEVCVAFDPLDCSFAQSLTQNAGFEVDVFPNPCTEGFWVRMRESGMLPIRVRITNGMGQTVRDRRYTAGEDWFVSMEEYPAGLYAIELMSGGQLVLPIRVVKLTP